MSFARLKRIKVTAPAVVVLATVVNAASPSAYAAVPEALAQTTATTDLSWAVRGGANEAQAARVLLARKAASDIRSLERVDASSAALLLNPVTPRLALTVTEQPTFAVQHASSSHQHSAP